jgi:hypothetical protein
MPNHLIDKEKINDAQVPLPSWIEGYGGTLSKKSNKDKHYNNLEHSQNLHSVHFNFQMNLHQIAPEAVFRN